MPFLCLNCELTTTTENQNNFQIKNVCLGKWIKYSSSSNDELEYCKFENLVAIINLLERQF